MSNHDVFFLQRGDGFPLEVVQSIRGPRLFWASELINPLLGSGLFDHVFFHSSVCLETAVARGWLARERGSVLLNGFDEELHQTNGHVEPDIDVLFCGSLTPRRQKWLDELRERFKVFVAASYGEELVRLIHRSKIVLNLHAEDHQDTETRIFEVLGCGAFLLSVSERLSSDNPFTSEHLAEFDTLDELHDKVDYFLEHTKERHAIARRGHEEALLKHTYTPTLHKNR